MLKFGDVIKFGEFFFIYLADKGDNYTYYFAKIISDQDVIERCVIKKKSYKPKHNIKQDTQLQIISCFTILTSDDFKDDMAFFAGADASGVDLANLEIVSSINIQDIEDLKTEILANPNVLPRPLVNAIKELVDGK